VSENSGRLVIIRIEVREEGGGSKGRSGNGDEKGSLNSGGKRDPKRHTLGLRGTKKKEGSEGGRKGTILPEKEVLERKRRGYQTMDPGRSRK